ncbi:MAG: sensor histidine kinase [Lachnospiraceae bacterium]|nr:sensor histidine kinase [Lachnospiraceae bacterium]
MRFFDNLQMSKKLIFIYLLTGFLPICIVCVMFFSQMTDVLQQREINNLAVAFEREAESLDTELKLCTRMSDYIAFNRTVGIILNDMDQNNFDVYQRLVKEFDPMMDSVKYFYTDINQVSIYVKRNLISHGNYLLPYADIAEEPWAELEDDDIKWYADQENRKILLIRNMPLMNGGLLYVSMDYDRLLQKLELASVGSYSVFIYEGHTPVYEYMAGTSGGQIEFAQFQEIKEAQEDSFVVLEHPLAQTKYQWTIGCVMAKDQMTSPMDTLLKQTLLIWGLCIALSLVALLYFAKNISVRVKHLDDRMKTVESGNLDVQISDTRKDELGDLARGFDHMVVELRRLIREVYQSQIAQKKYEMTALRAQINPHFLYNSLSLINWKALEIGAEDISKATLALSRYYRTSLNKGKNVMPIREELDNVKAYLEIQEMFHDYSFDVEIAVAPDIMEYETLNLVLQPLVENAIHHGIDQLRDRKGVITITGSKEGQEIVLKVTDNGNGMSQEKAESILQNTSPGYGVKNVHSRIQLQYGESYGLIIHSVEGVGTEIQVHFPAVEQS